MRRPKVNNNNHFIPAHTCWELVHEWAHKKEKERKEEEGNKRERETKRAWYRDRKTKGRFYLDRSSIFSTGPAFSENFMTCPEPVHLFFKTFWLILDSSSFSPIGSTFQETYCCVMKRSNFFPTDPNYSQLV